MSFLFCRSHFCRNHARVFRSREFSVKSFAFARGEFDDAGKTRVERVVTASAHIQTRMDFGAALAHDDGAGVTPLSVVDFYAEPF